MFPLLRRWLLAGSALLLTSCLSPTLPLPPPTEPQVSAPDLNGMVRLQGVASPNVEVFAENRNNGRIAGQITKGDARYDFEIAAQANDSIEVWYVKGADQSQSVFVTVPEPE